MARVDAGAVPGSAVHGRRRLPGRPVSGIRGAPPIEDGGLDDRPVKPVHGGANEDPGIGANGDDRLREIAPAGDRLDVDEGPALAGGRHAVAVARDLRQAATEHEHGVGALEALPDDRRRAEAGHPEVERMVVRDDVAAAPAGDDRDVQQLGEPDEVG